MQRRGGEEADPLFVRRLGSGAVGQQSGSEALDGAVDVLKKERDQRSAGVICTPEQ